MQWGKLKSLMGNMKLSMTKVRSKKYKRKSTTIGKNMSAVSPDDLKIVNLDSMGEKKYYSK